MSAVKRVFNDVRDGRAYVGEFFAKVLRTHEYRQYIADRLAGDFACALSEALCQMSDALCQLKAERDAMAAECETLRKDRRACWEEFKAMRRSTDETERELRAEVARLWADKLAMTETHVIYTWLRKKCDQPSNDTVAVQMNIGHDWVTVHDLDSNLRTMIDREEP